MQAAMKPEDAAPVTAPVNSTAIQGSASRFVSVALLLIVPAPTPYVAEPPVRNLPDR